MNIFIFDNDPIENAKQHCDKHVVKMILEYAQLLCTAHRVLDNTVSDVMYRATHAHHPCTKWVMDSKENYMYLYKLMCAVMDEYTFRYGKVHLTDKKLREILNTCPKTIISKGLTNFAQAMPDCYKNADSVIAYRQYFIGDKTHLASWKKRDIPSWYK